MTTYGSDKIVYRQEFISYSMQYFKLMGSVCEGGFMKRQTEKKIPVTTRQDDRHSLVEERRKVTLQLIENYYYNY